jgi:hypothetical protein
MENEELYSDPRLYNDGSGRGAMIAKPVATPANAMANMKSLRPGGSAAPISQENTNESIESDDSETQYDTDYLESLFNGENLSEEFMSKTKIIFEAAINEKVSLIEQNILEAAKEIIEEQVNSRTNHITEQVDNYLNYVISEWMEENKVAIERGLRTEIAEHFMLGLKELLEETFIDVPESKYDIVDEITKANEELQEQLNEQIRKNIELVNENTARLCAEAFIDISSDLTDTEIEKLASLSEGIEFSNLEQYKEKVNILKESYFTKNSGNYQNQQNLTEESTGQMPLSENVNPGMNALVEAMSRLNRNTKKPQQKINENSNAAKLMSMLNSNMSQDQYI